MPAARAACGYEREGATLAARIPLLGSLAPALMGENLLRESATRVTGTDCYRLRTPKLRRAGNEPDENPPSSGSLREAEEMQRLVRQINTSPRRETAWKCPVPGSREMPIAVRTYVCHERGEEFDVGRTS